LSAVVILYEWDLGPLPVLVTVRKLASAANTHSTSEICLPTRIVGKDAVLQAASTKPREKLSNISPKKIRSRQHRVSEINPIISKSQMAHVITIHHPCCQ